MKRLLAIFFLFTFLSANTAFGEVLKLPMLIHHYMEHSNIENKISFIDFLKEHYTNLAKHGDSTQHHHEKLPFKTIDSNLSHVVSVAPKIQFSIAKILYPCDNIIIPVYQDDDCSNNYLNSIWQPPRLS
ncbi:MAG: hypothetical protein JST23_10955 [Bacteroidetes bacterium]|nr:hypothetical protein [Bacteroidota bacterium]